LFVVGNDFVKDNSVAAFVVSVANERKHLPAFAAHIVDGGDFRDEFVAVVVKQFRVCVANMHIFQSKIDAD
jgi:hypothetical protein